MSIDNLLWMLFGAGLGIALSMLVLSAIAWSDRRLGNAGAALPASDAAARGADVPPFAAERKPTKRKRPPLMPIPDSITSLEALDRPLLAPEGDALLARSADVPVVPPAADVTGLVVVTPIAVPVAATDIVPEAEATASAQPERGSADWWAEQGIAETLAAGRDGTVDGIAEPPPAPPEDGETSAPAPEPRAAAEPEIAPEIAAPEEFRPAPKSLTPPPRRVAVAANPVDADPLPATAETPEPAMAARDAAPEPDAPAEPDPLVDLDAAFAAVLDVAPPVATPEAPPPVMREVMGPVQPAAPRTVAPRTVSPRPVTPRPVAPRPVPPRPAPRAAPPPAAAVVASPLPPEAVVAAEPMAEVAPEPPMPVPMPAPTLAPTPAPARPNRMPQLPEEVPGVIVGGVRFAPVPKRPTLPKSPIAGDKSSPASE